MPVNQFLRKIRVALTPRGRLLKTKLASGAIVFGRNRPGFGGRGIFVYRDSIEPEFEHLEDFLDPSGVLIDIGANTGIYTIKAARHCASMGGEVLSVEPFLDVLTVLARSVQANAFDNVRLRNFCVGQHTGPGSLWKNFDKPNLFSLIQRDSKASCLPVLTVTLDDLVSWEKLDRIDYIKIDVEGGELQVLQGGMKTIEKFRPIVQTEVTIADVSVDLGGYSVFQAPESPNKVYFPDEHPKIHLAKQLGWIQKHS